MIQGSLIGFKLYSLIEGHWAFLGPYPELPATAPDLLCRCTFTPLACCFQRVGVGEDSM